MAMTAAEKQRVIGMLDELERSKLDKVLASIENFGNWMRDNLYSIYCKVKDALYSMWQSIRNFFS
jgi:hypothetical protein